MDPDVRRSIGGPLGSFAVVRLLVQRGDDKDDNDIKLTHLMVTCSAVHVAVVDCMLEQGTEMDRAAHNGKTALLWLLTPAALRSPCS